MLPKIESPKFEIEIPSTKEKATFRCMKVRDEKVLLMARQGNDTNEILSAIKQVVTNCSESKLDIDNLALFDLEYIFLQLRSHSISDVAEVAYIDNDEVASDVEKMREVFAGKRQEEVDKEMAKIQKKATRSFKIKLNDVKVVFPEGSDKTIQISNEVGMVLKYPPASLYTDSEFLQADPDQIVDLLITKSIEKIYDGDEITDPSKEKLEDLREWINDLDPKTHEKIERFFTELPHLSYEIKYTNRNGKEQKIVLSTLNDFFLFV